MVGTVSLSKEHEQQRKNYRISSGTITALDLESGTTEKESGDNSRRKVPTSTLERSFSLLIKKGLIE
jgi:hypothetical protein